MAYQTRDVVDAMTAASGHTVTSLRADGGASVMDLLLQLQADQLGVPVARPDASPRPPRSAPPTWPAWPRGCGRSLDELAGQWAADVEMTPKANGDAKYQAWRRAVERSRGWET